MIYLSDGKLRQFLPSRRVPRTGALKLATPFGGIDIDAPVADGEQDRLRRLDQVDRHLNRTARWYAEPDLRPGQWVQFEAPLRCVTLNGAYRNLVLFSDPAPGEVPAHETDCRLLLHGSAHHLLGLSPVPVEGPVLEAIGGGDSSSGTTFLTHAGRAVEALSATPPPAPDPSDPEDPADPPTPHAGVRSLLAALDHAPELAGTATWMRGLARVTIPLETNATAPRCLVASPLTVEAAHDLP
ncbi:SAVMC3_10250 family protein [Streptomyces sp. NPDC007084]|uniref:SAVMC3_10250 family protein n=1 Tax=Streptomyces sp. NPDC007084 TaxID=3154313 RepID=UPI003453BB96